ncbi:uncharacterized protein LOC135196080 [Macrobrachium nipponense]|uniref:uncharacterized protein LOC135196080 n=1 Tax=Macrobrachium nipponense TaxID=159736 RepID=UPI0030C8B84E
MIQKHSVIVPIHTSTGRVSGRYLGAIRRSESTDEIGETSLHDRTMKLLFPAVVALACFCQSDLALPNGSESAFNETEGTSAAVNRNGVWGSQNYQKVPDDESYSHYGYNNAVPQTGGATYNHNSPAAHHKEYPSENENSYAAPQTSYEDLHYDYKPQLHLLLSPGQGSQRQPVCPQLGQFSVIGVIFTMLLIFNALISALSMYSISSNGNSVSLINTLLGTNTDNNQDTNNADNVNTNFQININPFNPRQFGDGLQDEEIIMDFEDEDDCSCSPLAEEDSWLFRIKKHLQGAWTVAQDFISENPDCTSRLACEAASFVPSSLSGLLAAFPTKTAGTRTLLKSAAAGHCSETYGKCPISLNAALNWL